MLIFIYSDKRYSKKTSKQYTS